MWRIGVLSVLSVLLWLSPAVAGQATLNWKDNSTGEVGFKIERGSVPAPPVGQPVPANACDAASNYAQIAQTAANVTSFVDPNRPEGTGQVDCYRLKAFTASAESGYSNTSGVVVPLAAPSSLTVGP